ncbi:unnamed protein product [Rotaria sordida]|uniref:TRPM SLOG domain-containing protein n=1 Tax=Rotaria sordida TaxID=392033 RepID=A0A819XS49_9BILA
MPSQKSPYEKWCEAISTRGLNNRPTCNLFSKQQQLPQVPPQQEQNDECDCGRLKRSHSYEGPPKSRSTTQWNFYSCSAPMKNTKNFGILYHPYELYGTKFIRCATNALAEDLYNLICEDCSQQPSLIISICGGEKYFKMNKRLEKEFMRGIIEAAKVAGNV